MVCPLRLVDVIIMLHGWCNMWSRNCLPFRSTRVFSCTCGDVYLKMMHVVKLISTLELISGFRRVLRFHSSISLPQWHAHCYSQQHKSNVWWMQICNTQKCYRRTTEANEYTGPGLRQAHKWRGIKGQCNTYSFVLDSSNGKNNGQICSGKVWRCEKGN